MSIQQKYGLTDEQLHNVIERTQDSLEKVGMSDALKTGLGVAGMSLASAGVAYAIPAAVEAVRESRVRRNRDEYIKNMTKVFPEIKGIPKSDLHTAYNSLAMHSPHVLSDPLLGGQTLKSMANYRQADISALNEINKLRGGSLTDQALLNASNIAAGGMTEGYKTYVQQRDAASEQAYREKMDKERMGLEGRKAATEFGKLREAREQNKYRRERDDIADRRYKSEREYSVKRDQAQDAYRKDQDATNEARFILQQARTDYRDRYNEQGNLVHYDSNEEGRVRQRVRDALSQAKR